MGSRRNTNTAANRARLSGVTVGVKPKKRTRRQVAAEFRALLSNGARLKPVGEAKRDPGLLLRPRYVPKHAVELFGATYYLTDFLYEEALNFFVAYVGMPGRATANGTRVGILHPRIFYKDSSLIWRVASHVIGHDGWIGKGDVRVLRDAHGEHLASDEDTTNLPYEIQTAFDEISRRRPAIRDDDAIRLVLRNAPPGRIRPYADFSKPRLAASRRHPIHRGRPIARIARRGDPRSLRFARGYEPELEHGVIEIGRSASRLYGGEVFKYRILSRNGQVQYQFVATPTHVWINPPQALTDEITSYGVRALHVAADEEIFVPGFEYHFHDRSTDPPELHSQIPEGWAGAPSGIDPERADASPWIERLPVIREFRRRVLGRRRSGPRPG